MIVKTISLTVVFKIVMEPVAKPMRYGKVVKFIVKSVGYYYNLQAYLSQWPPFLQHTLAAVMQQFRDSIFHDRDTPI